MSTELHEHTHANPYGVTIGQIWQDNDRRQQEGGWGPRFIKVYAVHQRQAECYVVDRHGRITAADDKRYRNGKPRLIRLDRFKPTSTGYRLVSQGDDRMTSGQDTAPDLQ